MATRRGAMNSKSRQMTIKGSTVKNRVTVVSLGCAKNLVNSEQMMYLLKEAGYELTGETDGTETVIVNTCAFIESAKAEAIETILELGEAKKSGRIGRLIVAGCLPERYKSEILAEMPEIDAVVGTGSFDDIVSVLAAQTGDKVQPGREPQHGVKPALFGDINAPVSETGRVLTTSPLWVYIKIAEGCDNRCAYCVIPDIRGSFRSRRFERIIEEAEDLAGKGVRELILVAQDLTRYGLDIYGGRRLPELLVRLAEIDKLKWIRLHYLYPDDISEELIDVIAENDKILKYLDIPIQHINDGILRNMNRRGSGGDIRALLGRLRERIPGLVLRTSIITGLPGEGESEFEELSLFLRETGIERAGVFTYSPEEGTAASLMDYPDPDTAARRKEFLDEIQSQIMDRFNEKRVGSQTEVLVEHRSGGSYFGRSFAESPDVDGYICIKGSGIAVNEFRHVSITGVENGEPVGEVLRV